MILVSENKKREALQQEHIKELEHLALHDNLTGLPNKTLLLDRIIQGIHRSQRAEKLLLLLFINVDRFHGINNTMGRQFGDLVLQQVATRISGSLRKSDTVARFGSDEFAVVLPSVADKYIIPTAKKIQKILEPSFVVDGVTMALEFSIGMAIYPQHGKEAELLIQHSEIALHLARKEKTGLASYDPDKDDYSVRSLSLAAELRQAISDGDLILHYQPKLDISSATITAVEALVRWQHPREGMIPPGEFIPLAEQTGLIKPLTVWVLKEAIQQCQTWLSSGMEIKVAVNISARNLQDHSLPDQISGFLSNANIPPSMLILEITESAIMTDPAHSIDLLAHLNAMGIKISIDDYGTGYSSLAYISKMPVTELKIDQSFISGMTKNKNDDLIVRSTINLGRNLGIKVVAEGIEDEQTLKQLDSYGCDIAQGYFISRPQPPDLLIDAIRKSEWKIKKRH